MLFNSPEFVYLYLPLVLVGFFWLARSSHRIAAVWLAAASCFFYGWWNPVYLGLLGASVAFNYSMGIVLARESSRPPGEPRRMLLVFAVAANLLLLGYFKYFNFFADSARIAFDGNWHFDTILLPLGISFFTFTQIAFLVDAWRGEAKEFNFVHYTLFVTYFPHLIAGPVLHHREMMPQFARAATYRLDWENIAVGLAIFVIGIFKKVVLADGIAPHANAVFLAAEHGQALSLLDAWGGALAYTFQLYFDFSGYSDMAIGLSRMFGVNLPLNFDSPYKARNISDFWRRWHMTLSRFLRDYLYIALGGNRKGAWRRHINLFVTMVLGGLWHGAGWTFVVWGALHGLYLMVNHAWRWLVATLDLRRGGRIGGVLGWALTFVAVVVAWVFFRASSFDAALSMLGAMAGGNGVILPPDWLNALHWRLVRSGAELGIVGGALSGQFADPWVWFDLLLVMTIALFAPNTQQIMARYNPALDFRARAGGPGMFRFRIGPGWLCVTVLLLAAALTRGDAISEFLYFQF